MRLSPTYRLVLFFCLLALPALGTSSYVPVSSAEQQSTISYWGMNLYLTKRERLATGDNLPALAAAARNAGVQWTREELPWDLIEPSDNAFRTLYDGSLKLTADNSFGVIGMLLTTPGWARDPTCRASGPTYWCPPADAAEYAQFAGWMAERYDGDGANDAPGSPRVGAWEIWNEPNDTLLWPNIAPDADARKRRYGDMLVAAYHAIKAADPTALVLTGGVYIYDGGCWSGLCDGMNFFNAAGGVFQQVPAALQAFDVFSIHPYVPTVRPDDPGIPQIITVEGRIRSTRGWLDGIGRSNAPIWITEMGWCTGPGVCPGNVAVTEEAQASYLTRSMVIAQHAGVQHTSWFQFEDAFNNTNREWSNAAIVRHYDGSAYPAKPAYNAYRTLVRQLGGASIAGTGPLHTHVYSAHPHNGDHATYNYRYTRGGTTVDVLWRPADSIEVQFPVIAGQEVTRVDRDGAETELTPAGGTVSLTIGERPVFIVQGSSPALDVSPRSLHLLAETGATSTRGTLSVRNSGGGSLSWTASTSTSWLALSPASGTAPGIIGVTARTDGRAGGTYTGSVTMTGSDGSGTITIPVYLTLSSTIHRGYLPVVRR
ncbi:MAG: GH39 / GH5 [uncultured Chloroflexia bacterium]|uniref:GH39 / GH5 n=1 Tax=uncultured Chloroflexia bacterium TaxID=1672391 RepID=A0A6J4JCJ0_9CHLR|nr:MAG: GH39 / GH5 [uncultured Chloroflexia bacterium]